MTDSSEPLVTVATVLTDVEASIVVCALENHGMRAIQEGGLTAAMRAETPGLVRVLVHESEVSEARSVLRKLREQPSS